MALSHTSRHATLVPIGAKYQSSGLEDTMGLTITALMAVSAFALPFGASGQSSDSAYCVALIQQYQKFLTRTSGHSPNPGTVDGSVAVEQCKSGNTADGIPVLERKPRDARIDLPKRGSAPTGAIRARFLPRPRLPAAAPRDVLRDSRGLLRLLPTISLKPPPERSPDNP
jgi:hypothetical protein